MSVWYAVFGGMTMILGAIYMLYAYQRIMLGEKNPLFEHAKDIQTLDYVILIPLIIIILALGIYPQPVLDLLGDSVISVNHFLMPVNHAITSLVQ